MAEKKIGGKIAYATPEWATRVIEAYNSNPEYAEKVFKGMTLNVVFKSEQAPEHGLDDEKFFCLKLEDGVLKEGSGLISKKEALETADFILAAKWTLWKDIIQRRESFVTNFMTGSMKLDKGEASKVLALTPTVPAVVDIFEAASGDIAWPDEMSPEELEEYRDYEKEITKKLG